MFDKFRDEIYILINWGTNLAGPCKFKDEYLLFTFPFYICFWYISPWT